MIYDIGDRVTLSTVVKDDTGALVNTPTLTLAVTKPDGTAVSPAPSVTNTGAGGVYAATVLVDQAGTWTYAWTASGTVTAVDPGQFTVDDQRVLVASLEEFKKHLRRTDLTDDDMLRGFLTAATDVVEGLIGGPISVQTFTEIVKCTGDHIVPLKRPLVSVTSLTPDLATAALDPATYQVDTTTDVVRLRYPWARPGWFYTLVYTAGLSTIREQIHIGGLMVAAWLWQVENGGGGRPFTDDTTTVGSYTIPRRAYQMLDSATPIGIG